MVDYQTEIAREIHLLGLELLKVGKPREAAMSFRKVLALSTDFPDAGLSLGHCLHLLGEYREALSVYDQLLKVVPDSAALWNNRGNSLIELGAYEDAAESYQFALDILPDLHDARVALASCYQSMGMPDKAMEACQAVLASAPDHAEAHWNRALLLLLKGEYTEGWQEYEWRWKKRTFTSPARDFAQPRWNGEALTGKTLLVHAEQGFGDTIQFCRFIPQVAALGAKVIFECQAPLTGLMKSLSGCSIVLPMGCQLPKFDMHVPLLSLPMILGIRLQTIPANTPYLSSEVDSILKWSFLVRKDMGLNVGICWSGKSYPDPGRSCPVEALKPLADIGGINWHSLQVGWNSALPFPMADNTDSINDFADTAALIAHLDLVVTIDTAVAHLAGALGKKVLLMVPFAPDWRWMQWWDDSPWYPTMRIFRQDVPSDWGGVISRMLYELSGLAKAPDHGFRKTDKIAPKAILPIVTSQMAPVNDLLHQGRASFMAGDLKTSESLFRKVLSHATASAEGWNDFGTVLDRLGKDEEAMAAYRACLKLDPVHAVAWYNLGNIFRKNGSLKDAESCYRSSCNADNKLTPPMQALGSFLIETGELDRAEELLQKAAIATPPNADARFSLGILCQKRDLQNDAEKWFLCTLSIETGHLQALTSLGLICMRSNRLAEATSFFERITTLDPGHWQAINNLGIISHWSGDLAKAESYLNTALNLYPENGTLHYNRALLLLARGDFEEGWQEYEWRFRKEDPVPELHQQILRWRGEDLRGHRILVHAEQGYGDTIHFSRYLIPLAERGCRIFLQCQDRNIAHLLEGFAGVEKVFARDDALPEVDFQSPLLSLPYMLGSEAWLRPAPNSGLHLNEDAVQKWRKLLAGCTGMKVGIVWAGRKEHENDRNRSLALDVLAPLADIDGVSWVNLQIGSSHEAAMPLELVDLTSGIASFADTAALIVNLDLVICVDSAIAHLAGTLEKPVWCLLPFNPDWRWMRDRVDTQLYPTMRLFRQKAPDTWLDVVLYLAAALKSQKDSMVSGLKIQQQYGI